MCPDGLVYNFEVEGTHTYVAGGYVVHNCHHAPAASYRKILDYFDAKLLGVTATPDRGDRKALGAIFDSVAHVYDIADAIKDKWLVPIRAITVMAETIHLENVSTVAGDFNQGQLAEEMGKEENLHAVVNPLMEGLVGERRTLVFTTHIELAHRMAEIMNRHRPGCAVAVDGTMKMDERRAALGSHQDGRHQYLVNVGVATEGYDDPLISAVVIARPTKSRALFAQMIGRGTRIAPGKTDLLVVDYRGNLGKHELVAPHDILAGRYDDEVVAIAKRLTANDGTLDVLAALELAAAEKAREEARKLAMANVRGKVSYRSAEVDPFVVFGATSPGVSEFDAPPSDKQLAALGKFRVPIRQGITKREANKLLDMAIGRAKHNLCSFKQMQVLQRYGYNARNMRFAEASALMDRLAKNNWKPLPHERQPGEDG